MLVRGPLERCPPVASIRAPRHAATTLTLPTGNAHALVRQAAGLTFLIAGTVSLPRKPYMEVRQSAGTETHTDDRGCVVMVSGGYAPEVLGGAERQCQKLAAALVRNGRRVVVLTSSRDPTSAPSMVDGVEIVRFRSRWSPQVGGRHLPSSIIWGWRICAWVRRHREQVSVIHAHQAKLNAFWSIVAATSAKRPPVVVKIGLDGPNSDLRSLQRKRYLYGRVAAWVVKRRTARFVAISSDIERDLIAEGVPGYRVTRIPNGVERPQHRMVDAAERRQARAKLELAPSATCFVTVGRIVAQKNLHLLLKVFADAARKRDDLRLVIVGEGELRSSLEVEAAQLGVSDVVLFPGWQADVDVYIKAADAFVLPSLAEGMSNALLESMSLGVLPIASAVSGTNDIIRHGVNGFLFDLSNPAGLADAMAEFLRLTEDERHRCSSAAFDTIATEYDIDRVATIYENLYADLTGGSNW
jgi:glycosyltransferase involved in cell wall biosynthesis